MGEFRLEEITVFSKEKTISTNVFDSEKVSVNFLGMEEGQSALEETKDQKVIIIINSGNGSVVTDEGEQDIEEGTFIMFESGEARLIKAKTKLTAIVAVLPKG